MDIDSDVELKPAPLSIRHGPIIDDDDDDAPIMNGKGKRKSRSSISKVDYHESDKGNERVVGLAPV